MSSVIARERKWQRIKRLNRLLYRNIGAYSRKYWIESRQRETWGWNEDWGGVTKELDHIKRFHITEGLKKCSIKELLALICFLNERVQNEPLNFISE